MGTLATLPELNDTLRVGPGLILLQAELLTLLDAVVNVLVNGTSLTPNGGVDSMLGRLFLDILRLARYRAVQSCITCTAVSQNVTLDTIRSAQGHLRDASEEHLPALLVMRARGGSLWRCGGQDLVRVIVDPLVHELRDDREHSPTERYVVLDVLCLPRSDPK